MSGLSERYQILPSPTFVSVSGTVMTVMNLGPSTVYYGRAQVTSSSNDGSIAAAASAAVPAGQYFVTAAGLKAEIVVVVAAGEVDIGDAEARITALETTIVGKQDVADLDQPDGYAGLDGAGRILLTRVPAEISSTAVAIHRKTANFTVTTVELGGLFIATSAGAIVCTIPVNTDESFAVAGEGCSFVRAGAGGLTFAGSGTATYNSATGVTTFADGQKIMSPFGFLAAAEIGSAASMVRDNVDPNLWYLTGDLE